MSSCLDCWNQTEKWLKSNAPDFVYESAESLKELAHKQQLLVSHQQNVIQLKEKLITSLVSEDDDISQDEIDAILEELEATNQQIQDLI